MSAPIELRLPAAGGPALRQGHRLLRRLRDRRTLLRAGRTAAVLAVTAYLVQLHAALLWDRIITLSLLEPLVALRWAGAAALLLVSLGLQRRGVSVFRGRKAAVFWLLVLLLHANAALPATGELGVSAASQPEAALLVVLPLCLSLAPALWLGLMPPGARAGTRPRCPAPPYLSPFAVAPSLALREGFRRSFSPRPPPV